MNHSMLTLLCFGMLFVEIGSAYAMPPDDFAGPDQDVHSNTTVTLSSSVDDGRFYYWYSSRGPSITLNDLDTATPSFLAPTVANGAEPVKIYIDLLLFISGDAAQYDDSVTITVYPLDTPLPGTNTNSSDTTPPTITITGGNFMSISLGSTFTEPEVTCTDDLDPSPTLVRNGTVSTDIADIYTITYTCTDSSNNTATVTLSVTVTSDDNTLPVIDIQGDNPLTIIEGDSYSDPVATCTDDVDGLPDITTSGTVDPATPGTYTVTYECTDSSSNTATATLKVIVKLDVAPYTISIETETTNTIIMNMSENVQNVEAVGFTISGIASNPLIDSVAATSSDDIIVLTLSAEMIDSDSPRLAYNSTAGSITDLRNKPLASFDKSVKNILDTTAPTVRSVTIDNSGTVHVRLSESVVQGSAEPSDFTTNNLSITVSSITVSGSTVTLDLSGEIPTDTTALTLSYAGGPGQLTDEKGNHLEGFDDKSITKQSRKRSTSTSTPAVDLTSLQSLGYMDYSSIQTPHDPYAPIAPMNAGDSTGFAFAINDMHYLLGGTLNTLEPQTLLTDTPNTISFVVYDRADIAHFTLYMNLHGQDSEYMNSDTYVTYDMGNIRIVDPHSFISNTTVSIKTNDADSLKHIVVFVITFEGEMEQTNLVARTWNTGSHFTIVRILDAFSVSAAQHIPLPDLQPVLSEDLVPDVVSQPEDAADTTPDPDTAKIMIHTWSGFEAGSVTDVQLLEVLGLEHDGDIPSWVMTKLGVLFSQDSITIEEFTTAISYVISNI